MNTTPQQVLVNKILTFMMRNFTLAFLLFVLSGHIQLAAQNSTCATAATLQIDMNCGGDENGPGANTGDPTGNDDTDGNVCSSNYSRGDDFIYEYTATSTDALQLDLYATNTWTGLMVTEGCPTTGTCIASSTTSARDESVNTGALTSGVTYYIHISTWPSPQSAGQFCLDAQLTTPPTPPANDNCSSPTALTVNADEACGTTTAGTIELASASGEDESSCSGTEDDDVWYTFVATATTHSISLINVTGSTTDLYHSLWSGSCGALTNILCSDPNTSTATGLTIGTTYLLRVYTWTAASGQTTTFDVCIGTPEAPPANDDCSGALDYDTAFGAIGTNGTCNGNTDMLDISSYTDTGTDPTCDFGGDATAWYTWTANTESIVFTAITGGPGLEILDGSCGSFTSVGCLNNTSGSISGLTIGVTYYFIIWDDGTAGTTLEWCIEAAPAAPANDACGDAIALSDGANTTESTVVATNIESLSACSGGGGGDDCSNGGTGGIDFGAGVWYVYTSSGAEAITVSTDNPGTNFDTEIQVFSGSCGSLVCVGGDDDGGSVNLSTSSVFCWESTASFAPVDYYIYVDGHSANSGTFELTLNTAAILPVELAYFRGEVMEKSNMLKWETTTEENTQVHIIERSIDGRSNWQEIGQVAAAGNTTESVSYTMEDKSPLASSFYRLKSVDFDGVTGYSEIVFLERKLDDFEVVNIMPNPTRGSVNINLHIPESGRYTVRLTNMVGQRIYLEEVNLAPGLYSQVIDMSNLTSGIYFVSIEHEQQSLVHKIVKQ